LRGTVFTAFYIQNLFMEKMVDLRDLLKHEIQDLTSAEDQMIEAMPAMIQKANNSELKRALTEHLRITEKQRKRLDEIQRALGESSSEEGDKKGLFSRLFGSGGHKCKGMEGLITEGQKVMGEDMNPEVLDAAIIACAQKMEHYEITGYGTAKAFARELNLREVERLLDETLNEEYNADDLLTVMAVGKLNVRAENANSGSRRSGGSKGGSKSSGGSKSKSSGGGSKSSGSKSSKSSGGGRSSGASKGGSKSSGSKSSKSSGGGRSSGASKGGSKSSRGSKSSKSSGGSKSSKSGRKASSGRR
jgi:ferritin-like metal-binding protein YciE